jgi:anti-sigma factor RsiW
MTNPFEHCADCVELLGEYVDGTLPPEKAQALEAHLSLCPPCITFVRTYKATRVLCRHKLAAEMPPELCDSLNSFLAKNVPGYAPPPPSPAADRPASASPPNKKN